MRRPLEGIRVLDFTIWQQGTYASALLADFGADVIKVEEPGSGDPGRYFDYVKELGLSSYFEAHNRGKRSFVVDLKQERGREAFYRVAKTADAFLTNFRGSVLARLGVSWAALSAENPRIVYVQAHGYGPAGADADLGSFDILAQARGGLMSMTGEPDDPPLPAGVAIADQVGGMQACIAVLSGIMGRNATGRGVRLDTSLLGSQISLQSCNITDYLFRGTMRARRTRGGDTPFWRAYRAGDGQWFVIGQLRDRAWPEFAAAIGRPELVEDERFDTYRKRAADNAPALITILDELFATAPARQWIDRLNAVGMFAAPVQDYAQVAEDPQVVENGYVHEVEYPGHAPVRMAGAGVTVDGQPLRVPRLAPQHGEHTEAILLDAGYSWDEIAALRAEGAIGARKREEKRAHW